MLEGQAHLIPADALTPPLKAARTITVTTITTITTACTRAFATR